MLWCNKSVKEIIFQPGECYFSMICLCFLSSVQAAIGAVALDTVRTLSDDKLKEELEPLGKLVSFLMAL